MNFIKGFFEEEPGISSSVRLIFIIGSLFNMALTAYLASTGKYDLIALGAFFGVLETIFTGLKLGSRTIENKNV
jgi:hypothetical protein